MKKEVLGMNNCLSFCRAVAPRLGFGACWAIWAGLGWLATGSAWAGRISPEVLREIEGSLPPAESSPDEEWTFSGGGYVLRVDFDLTEDGRPELFVASSLGMNRGCPMWRIYHARKDGGYDPFLTQGEIKAGWTAERTLFSDFRFGLQLGRSNGKPAMAIPWHDRFEQNEEKRWGQLVVRFVGGNEIDLSQKFLDEDWVGDGFNGEGFSLETRVRGAMVVDLLRDPDVPWRPMDLNHKVPSGEGYFLNPEDQERARKLGAFTPNLAWRWLKLAKEGRTPLEEEKALEANAPEVPDPAPEEPEFAGVSKKAVPVAASEEAGPSAGSAVLEPSSFWMELLRFCVRWRAVLSGGATFLVAGWGVFRWRRGRG